jgi:hypothetical protein
MSDILNLPEIIQDNASEYYTEATQELHQYILETDKGYHHLLSVDCGNGEEEMTVGRVLANLAILYPFRVANLKPTHNQFIRVALNSSTLQNQLDLVIEDLYNVLDFNELNLATATSLNYLSDLACDVVSKVGVTISIKGLIDACKLDPEIEKLLNWQSPSGTLENYEQCADEANLELISRLKAIPGEFGRLLRSEAAINKDQLRQVLVNIGVKPGLLEGELVPEPIDVSFLKGLRNVEDYYICAGGARKALTTNYKQVKDSGYLSRKLVLLVANHLIDYDNEDCYTNHGINTVVQNLDHAKRLLGRYIVTNDNNDWHLVTKDIIPSLVNQPILLRSPATCGGKNGVCHVCYGNTAVNNREIHAGIYGVLIVSEQMLQRLLSSKHLLKAKPIEVKWSDNFYTYFSVERNNIIPENMVDRIYILASDIEIDEVDDGMMANTFYVKVSGDRTRHKITSDTPLYLDSEIWEDSESENGEYVISPDPSSAVFYTSISNKDLSEALHAIFGLIELEDIEDIDSGYNRFIELLIQSDIKTPSIHIEMILRALVRDASNLLQRPDYNQIDEPQAVVLKLPQAIINSSSVTNSLAFEKVKSQLTSLDIFKKYDKGVLDAFFDM